MAAEAGVGVRGQRERGLLTDGLYKQRVCCLFDQRPSLSSDLSLTLKNRRRERKKNYMELEGWLGGGRKHPKLRDE